LSTHTRTDSVGFDLGVRGDRFAGIVCMVGWYLTTVRCIRGEY